MMRALISGRPFWILQSKICKLFVPSMLTFANMSVRAALNFKLGHRRV
jgi:hypothetical protein